MTTTRSERLTVVGAGTMGHGIAHAAAVAGYRTCLYDIDERALANGIERVRANLEEGVARGKTEPSVRDAALDRLQATSSLEEAVAEAEAVIEAVPERLALKQETLHAVSQRVAPDTLLASNTSSLSITAIATAVPHPGRFIGMHFFNPVHIMKLVEVVQGQLSEGETVDRACAIARRMDKTPIVVRDSPGFASSRLGVALGLEAIRMLEAGVASAEDIDRAMELGYRHPMGPLRLTDLVGLDVRLAIARHLHRELGGEHFRPPAMLKRMVREGKLGRKTGEGFYRWETTNE